jgi:hypothetical protein
MDTIGIGAGLGALGFWAFIATCVIAGIWDGVRKRDAQHETLRRAIESGQANDSELMEKLLALSGGANSHIDRDLEISGYIMLFISPGLAVLGLFLGQIAEKALMALLGTSVLVGFIAFGLLIAARVYRRRYKEDYPSASNQAKG